MRPVQYFVLVIAWWMAACSALPMPVPVPAESADTVYSNVLPRLEGDPEAEPGIVCMALFGYGLTCLDETGWHSFDETNSPLRGNLHQIVPCPAGYFLILHTFGVTLFDGKERWLDIPAHGLPGFPDRASCDGQNNVWMSHWNGVSVQNRQDWLTYPLEEITGGTDYGDVQDLAVSPQGDLWVLLNHAIVQRVDESWVVYAEEKGLAENYSFSSIVLDSQGQPWVLHPNGLLHYTQQGGSWQEFKLDTWFAPEAVALDTRQHVWVLGFTNLIHIDPQGLYTDYTAALADRTIGGFLRDLSVDARGRLWLGTSWGLLVTDGDQEPTVYFMHNSGLASNEIFDLAVLAGGPDLPAPQAQPAGSLGGRLLIGGEPLAEAHGEICASWLITLDQQAEHPCSEFPEYTTFQSHVDGSFSVDAILPGRYWVIVQVEGKTKTGKAWSEPVEVHIQPGTSLELGDLVLK